MTLLSVRKVMGSILRSIESDTVSPTLSTAVTLLRSCVAQALSRGDGPRHSLHASAQHREYNKNLIFLLDLEWNQMVDCAASK